MKRIIVCVFVSFFILLPLSLEGKKRVIYKKKTTIGLDDTLIEGQENNPEGVYVVLPKDRNFKSLLRLRKNFHKELIRDALLLK